MTTGTGSRLHMLGRFVTAIVALIALGTCLSVARTSTATISGTVKDTSGGVDTGSEYHGQAYRERPDA